MVQRLAAELAEPLDRRLDVTRYLTNSVDSGCRRTRRRYPIVMRSRWDRDWRTAGDGTFYAHA